VRKRILKNKELMNTPETQAIWQTITDLLEKLYPNVYQDLDSFQWTEYMQPLITKIKQQTREYMFQLISKIYTSIDIAQATSYFGLPETDTLQGTEKKGNK
jgi:COP9 signalosome complex subunit 8